MTRPPARLRSINPDVFFFQAEDGIRDPLVTGVQTCALPISCDFISPGVACIKPVETLPVSAPTGLQDEVVINGEQLTSSTIPAQISLTDCLEIGRASCRERV